MLLPMLLCLAAVGVTHAAPATATDCCSWDKCNEWSTEEGVINVHLVPHSHDDLGWIKTVDQYYFGSKIPLVPVGVQYIYNTVIQELSLDPSRRFSFAEAGFLSRWYRTHSDFDRHKLQKLVKTGQVEMIGGGWVQHDEAAAHYVDIIDQMELGLKYLDVIFGECGHAQTAWQIDPFGHSREVANLFAMMGYSSLFFARVHYLEKAARLANKSLEFVWNTSDDLKTNILTGAFFQDNYGPPEGFCFDAMCADDPIQDFDDMEGYNVPEKMNAFVKHVRKQASYQRTKHVLLLMGSDFQYTNANMWFTNLDKLIHYVNENSTNKIRVFYSTPTCYVRAINSVAPRLPTKNDDFFPYASSNHSFWTGYFTSRPTFKRMIREASATLQLAKQLDAMAFLGAEDDSDVEAMKEASALVQHHDAVTGTAKENVTRDYEKRLAAGISEAEAVINDALSRLAAKTNGNLPHHFLCPLLNETVCHPLKSLSTFAVTVFNPLASPVSQILRIPFYFRSAVVLNDKGERVEAQLSKTFQSSLSTSGRAPFELSFYPSLPPLGFSTFFVDNSTSIRSVKVTHPLKRAEPTTFIENQSLRVSFDASGYVSAVYDKETNVTYPFRQQFLYYEGYDNVKEQTSGAYVFRPKNNEAKAFEGNPKVEYSKGPLVEEARQTVSPWASQIVRLHKNSRDIEFSWTIGPIPKEGGNTSVTKEIITRYTTGIKSAGIFYTDANGRQLIERKRNFHPSFAYEDTEPIAANYYPVTTSVHINDVTAQLTVLVDRAEGATSLQDGSIDVMLHRRCFYDDHWGVEEALDEPGTDGRGLVATGSHLIQIADVQKAASRLRLGAASSFHRPLPAFAAATNITDYAKLARTSFAGVTRPLPPSVHLLSLSKWHGSQLLLRLEHIFQSGDADDAATPISVDLKNLFTTFDVKSVKEVQLAGIRQPQHPQHRRISDDDLTVNLSPMEIRTLILDVAEKTS